MNEVLSIEASSQRNNEKKLKNLKNKTKEVIILKKQSMAVTVRSASC